MKIESRLPVWCEFNSHTADLNTTHLDIYDKYKYSAHVYQDATVNVIFGSERSSYVS